MVHCCVVLGDFLLFGFGFLVLGSWVIVDMICCIACCVEEFGYVLLWIF